MSSADQEEKAYDAVEREKSDRDATEYPTNQKRVLIMIAIYLAAFLVTLDQNIISTAIPRITDDFHSLDDVGWYGSAYLLTMCSFQLLMGKVYKFYPAKPVFLAGCIIFEIGSAICGAAPNSNVLIVGRAIAGLGSSGLFSGLMVIMSHTIPLQQRPIYQGAFGAVFAVASVVGPLIGGTFTDKVSWRWCFYINLPVGAVSVIFTTLFLHLPNQKLDVPEEGWKGKAKQLDPIGNLVFFPGIICLILALQWGGTKYAWKDGRIIALLVICAVLCLLFAGIQVWKKESATVPPRIVKMRSIAASLWFAFFSGAAVMIMTYYIPIWFQAVTGTSAIDSGIKMLPMILSTVVSSLSAGIITSKVGYYAPFFIISSIMMPIGAGLLSTLTPSTGSAKWIGYQILFGLGFGFGTQQPFIVIQTVLQRSDVATGTAVIGFTRFLGSSIFVAVAQSIFVTDLLSNLRNLTDISPDAVLGSGATGVRNLAQGADLQLLLADYNEALMSVFYLATATCAVTILGSVLVEWRSLKVPNEKSDDGGEKSSEVEQV